MTKPISALHDNYIWMILHPDSSQVLIVDPGDAEPVFTALKTENVQLSGILLTHHHWDHTNGVEALLKEYRIPVYGPKDIKTVTHPVKDGDIISFEAPHCQFKVIEIPGHTLDHIAYIGEGSVFCGDTLFTAGCGRVFEGTHEMMLESLQKLAALPGDTQIYCGHEYTQANLNFAKVIEPNNPDLLKRTKEVDALRSKNKPTVPASMALELKTNPFLRTMKNTIQAAASKHAGRTLSEPVPTFTEIRCWKDGF